MKKLVSVFAPLKTLWHVKKSNRQRDQDDQGGSRIIEDALKNSEKRKIAYLGNHRSLTTTIFGHQIIVDTRDFSITPHILTYGYWELWVTKAVLEIVKKDMIVLEVGANFGYYTLLTASLVGERGKVHAFEATPSIFENLFHTVNINGFYDRVTLVNRAVFDVSNRDLTLYTFEHCWGGNTIARIPEEYLKRRLEDKTTSIQVKSISLDDFVGNLPSNRIDFIKVDAQGSEPFIFKGMTNLIDANQQLKAIIEFEPKLIQCLDVSPSSFLSDIQEKFIIKVIDPYKGITDVNRDWLLNSESSELFLSRRSN